MAVVINGDTGIDKVQDGSIVAADLASGAITSASLPSGTVLQVVQTHLNTTSSQSLTGGTRANISGLNATITPRDANSKILITVRWNGEGSNLNNQDTVFGIKRDTTDIGNPATAGNRFVGISVIAQGYWGSDAASTPDSAMYQYLDSPATTSATTYHATILSNFTQTLYNQRTVEDTDNAARERLTSTITLMEIAG